MCLVDWTEWRPNVFFELGVRLAASKIAPVCVIEDTDRTLIRKLALRRDSGAKMPALSDQAGRLRTCTQQCMQLARMFDPIEYSCSGEADEGAYRRMVFRHEAIMGLRNEGEVLWEMALDCTYQAISKYIDWESEVAAKPVYVELANTADLLSAPGQDSLG